MNEADPTRLPPYGPGEGARFRASDRDLSCPACDGDRFWTTRNRRSTRMARLLDAFVHASVVRLTCETCAHVLWFQADAPLEALD